MSSKDYSVRCPTFKIQVDFNNNKLCLFYIAKQKQEIAKQFDLPERKSKIATLLKETDVYCICRSSDSTRFMM